MILVFPTFVFPQNYRLDQENLPIWEFGLSAAWLRLPYYPGSKDARTFALPAPAFIYRGDKIRADEDGGLRGLFLKSKKFEINASFGFNLPADQKDVKIREGMEELDPLFEIGPGIIYHLIPKEKNERFSLSLNIGLRYAFSSDLSFTKDRGFIVNPLLFSWFQITDKLILFTGLSSAWATKSYHGFFYDVPINAARVDRSEFTAHSGSVATTLSNFFILNATKKTSFFLGGIYDSFHNARNRDSPLHQRDENFSVIAGMTYWFYQSKNKQ